MTCNDLLEVMYHSETVYLIQKVCTVNIRDAIIVDIIEDCLISSEFKVDFKAI